MKPKDRKQRIHRDTLPAYVILRNSEGKKTLFKILAKNKPNDRVVLWNFSTMEREVHSYLAVAKFGEKAYSPRDIGMLVNRTVRTIKHALPYIPEPYRIYAFTDGSPSGRRWDADGVMAIRDHFASQHHGPPRKDGEIIPIPVPSRVELRAMLNQEAVYYVKTEDGSVVPTWKAHDF